MVCALGGGIGGVGYVIVRYLIGSQSDLPRLFASTYLLGGLILGLLPGAATGGIFLLLYTALLRFLPRGVAVVLGATLSGITSTILTCIALIALNEQLNALWFVGVFSAVSSAFLIVSGPLILRPHLST